MGGEGRGGMGGELEIGSPGEGREGAARETPGEP
jgi:hypothetical protein